MSAARLTLSADRLLLAGLAESRAYFEAHGAPMPGAKKVATVKDLLAATQRYIRDVGRQTSVIGGPEADRMIEKGRSIVEGICDRCEAAFEAVQ